MIQARNALQQRPEDGALRLLLGGILLESRDPVAAERELRKALQYLGRAKALAPDRWDIRLHYAKGLIKAGKKDVARSELEALQAVPDAFTGKAEIASVLKGL